MERWSFLAGLILVFVSAVAGGAIDQLWQPGGPSSIVDWNRVVALLGGLLIVVSFVLGTAAARAERRAAPLPT